MNKDRFNMERSDTSETRQLLGLLRRAAEREGIDGSWLEVVEDVLNLRRATPVGLVKLASGPLSEWLLIQALSAESASSAFEIDGIVDQIIFKLLYSSCFRDNRPAPPLEGCVWTTKQLMTARFYRWGDWAAWRDYFMEELERLDLPYTIWEKLQELVVMSFDPSSIMHPEFTLGYQRVFMEHFWRGDRFIEFHEWAQFVQNYDKLSIDGIGPARTRVLQQALREYLGKKEMERV